MILSAESGHYDQERGVFTVKNGVRLQQEGTVVYADCLSYDEKLDRLTAQGHVRIEDADGNVVFCDEVILTKKLKDGVLKKVFVVTQARERITAARASRRDGRTAYVPDDASQGVVQEMEMGSYTPCERCKDSLDSPPVWSLHARHISHDDEKKRAYYTDTHFEFLGVPIAYFPRFYLPTKRSSGFLLPYLDATRELGAYVGTPYYWAIDDHKDVTLTPFLTTAGGLILAEQYRHLFNNGALKISSAANAMYRQENFRKPNGQKDTLSAWRGYFREEGSYDINQHWRLRSDEWWVSDKTFLTTRPFFTNSEAPYLESKTAAEAFYDHHFIQLRGVRYQGLQPSDQTKTTPFIYPETKYFYDSPALWHGSSLSAQVSTLSLYRDLGNRTQRFFLDTEGKLPFSMIGGQQVTFFGYINSALYLSQLQEPFEGSPKASYDKGRFFPQGGVDYRWPLMIFGGVLTPIGQVMGSPTRVNKREIPNEDSHALAFDDTNIFSRTRYAGVDRMDDGSRANYGLDYACCFPSARSLSVFVGQSCSFSEPGPELSSVGIYKGFSDVVGRVSTNWSYATIMYRFRADRRRLSSKFQEIQWTMGPPVFTVEGSYVFSQQQIPNSPYSLYNQLYLTLGSQFTEYWSVKLFMREDFKIKDRKQRLLDKGISVAYQDECFAIGATVQHAFYRMMDLRPGYSVNFFVTLKNIGGVRQQKVRFSNRPP